MALVLNDATFTLPGGASTAGAAADASWWASALPMLGVAAFGAISYLGCKRRRVEPQPDPRVTCLEERMARVEARVGVAEAAVQQIIRDDLAEKVEVKSVAQHVASALAPQEAFAKDLEERLDVISSLVSQKALHDAKSAADQQHKANATASEQQERKAGCMDVMEAAAEPAQNAHAERMDEMAADAEAAKKAHAARIDVMEAAAEAARKAHAARMDEMDADAETAQKAHDARMDLIDFAAEVARKALEEERQAEMRRNAEERRKVSPAKRAELDGKLWQAASSGKVQDLTDLFQAGADVNAMGANQQTPLTIASRSCHVEAVKALVEAGADLETKGQAGMTALMWASWAGSVDAVKFLIEAGAEVNAKRTGDSWTALTLAEHLGNANANNAPKYKPIADYLRSNGATK